MHRRLEESMKICLIAALVLMRAPLAIAQEVTGQIEGRVLGADGKSMPAVNVTATSRNLIGTRTTMTGEDGRFYLRALPVGIYRIELRRIGYRPVALDSVRVWLGAATAVYPPALQSQSATELASVLVVADNDASDPTRTASSVGLSRDRLTDLPLGRNFREIALLQPEATPSFIGDGINIAGATGLENHFFVDGIDITNPVSGDKSIDLPYNFIEQIQLHTGGASAEDPQTLGGSVNVVTPSGGNEFAGSAFGFFSSAALQSASRATVAKTQTGFSFYDAGVTFSGPVARDRVWFFLAYNPRFEGTQFDYGFGSISDRTLVHQFAGKLTASLGKNTTVALTLLGDPRLSTRATLMVPAPSGLTALSRDPLSREDKGGGYAVSARVQSQLGKSFFLESTLSHVALLESGTPDIDEPTFVDFDAGTVTGGHGYKFRSEMRRHAASAAVAWQRGNHYLKVGARYEVLRNSSSDEFNQILLGGGTYTRIITTADAPGRIQNRNPAVFIQDVWQASECLSLSAGLRESRQEIVNLSGSRGDFRIHDGLQPRIGFVLQPGKLGTQRLYASYARVVQQLTLVGSVGSQRGYTLITSYPRDPRVDTTGEVTIIDWVRDGNGDRADDDLRATTADHLSLGYARQIGNALTLTVSGERRLLSEHITGAGNDENPLWGNPGRGAMSAFPRPRRKYDALHARLQRLESQVTWWDVSYTLSQTRGNFPGIFSSDYRANSQYGPSFDRSDAWQNSTGLLPNDRTHTLRAYGSRQLRYGFAIGGSILTASGTPRSTYSTHDGYLYFVEPRGTGGRTPWIWDAGVRASYALPLRAGSAESRFILDIEHFGNPRRAVDFDQLRYSCAANDTTCENATYRQVTQYQPPMSARVGIEVVF
jgi:hypothetical protein